MSVRKAIIAILLGVAFVASLQATRALAQAQLPVLDLSPNPVTGGQVTALGKNFCGDAGCSNVTIAVEERIAASNVPVTPGGTFEISFAVTEGAGVYLVTATQTLADGRTLRAEASMSVPTRDNQVSPPVVTASPAPTTPPVATTGARPTASPQPDGESPSPSALATSPSTPGSADNSTANEDGEDGWVLPLILALVVLAVLGGGLGLWARLRRSKTS